VDDEVYVEMYYSGAWHGNTTLTTSNTSDAAFGEVEIALNDDMMTYDFGVRFRNGMDAAGEYIEIDDFYLYGLPAIPTLSQWGMLALAGLLLSAGLWIISRRRRCAGLHSN
jgi:hypothetical protein